VDTDFLKPLPKDNPVSTRYGFSRKFVLMYSGIISISSYATLVKILETASLLKDDPEILFAVVGDGFKANDLKAQAGRLGLPNVVFLPFVPYAELPSSMASADVLLVPLDKEKSLLSVPSKVYNYMAAGRPILGLAHPDSEVFKLIGDTRCGVCVPCADPPLIAEAVRSLKNDPASRAAMGAGGRAYALSHFSRDLVLKRYEDLMASMR